MELEPVFNLSFCRVFILYTFDISCKIMILGIYTPVQGVFLSSIFSPSAHFRAIFGSTADTRKALRQTFARPAQAFVVRSAPGANPASATPPAPAAAPPMHDNDRL